MFESRAPKLLFQEPPGVLTGASDGNRFLMAVPADWAAQAPFTVLLNWQAGLKK